MGIYHDLPNKNVAPFITLVLISPNKYGDTNCLRDPKIHDKIVDFNINVAKNLIFWTTRWNRKPRQYVFCFLQSDEGYSLDIARKTVIGKSLNQRKLGTH